MSFTIVEQCTARLNRSELAVPGSSPKFFAKAAEGKADVVFLDLEDAVAPDDKEQARRNVIAAINEVRNDLFLMRKKRAQPKVLFEQLM